LCETRINFFHRAQIVKFVSFTGAFTCEYVVKSVKEACETVHSIIKENCRHATQFDRPCKTACFWWVNETPKDAQECDLGLCKFVGYFHVFPSSYLRRRKGPAVPKRDQQKMHRKSLYIFQTHEDARGPHVIDFPHLLLWYNHIINTVVNSCLKIRNNDDRDFSPKMIFIQTLEFFREFGMCSNPLVRTEPPDK